MTVSELTERELVARIRERLSPAPSWLVVGIGDDAAVGGESGVRGLHDEAAQPQPDRDVVAGERPMRPGVADQQIRERVGDRIGERLRQPARQGDAEGVTKRVTITVTGSPLSSARRWARALLPLRAPPSRKWALMRYGSDP